MHLLCSNLEHSGTTCTAVLRVDTEEFVHPLCGRQKLLPPRSVANATHLATDGCSAFTRRKVSIHGIADLEVVCA